MEDTYYIGMQIGEINTKISNYNTAKTKLQTVKTNCQGKATSLQSSYRKVSGNKDLSAVKKENVFEGEMANSLAQRVSTFQKGVSSVITKAEAVNTAIAAQISAIDTKVASLNNQKTKLRIQLENAQDQP